MLPKYMNCCSLSHKIGFSCTSFVLFINLVEMEEQQQEALQNFLVSLGNNIEDFKHDFNDIKIIYNIKLNDNSIVNEAVEKLINI